MKNKKLMIGIGVLLVLVVGISFAYYLVTVSITGNGGNTNISAGNLPLVQYDAGENTLSKDNMVPKDIITKTFKVIVTPTKDIKEVTYRIFIEISENTFVKCDNSNYEEITNECEINAEELVYRLKNQNGDIIKEGDLTGKSGEIEIGRETKTQETRTEYIYTIEIEFKDTGKEQNHNANKIFNGSIKVEYAGIDNEIPIIEEIETSSTENTIIVKVKGTDNEEITEYYYQIDNKEVVLSNSSTYSFTGLEKGSKHTIKVYVKDKVGNQSETKEKTAYTLGTSEATIAKLGITGVVDQTETVPDFSQVATTDEGLYRVEDGMYGGKSVYWRGASTTNHMIFANKCWRIVRINGDGTIRLIYNGDIQEGNTCTGNGSNSGSIAVASKAYNANTNNASYAGYTYTVGVQRPTPTTGGTESNLKTQTDTWYNNNIGNNEIYAGKVAEGKFCNDRTVGSGTWSATGSTFYYGAYTRLETDITPVLSCDVQDVYELKAGAITADEIVFAGGKKGFNNTSYYLYNGQYYWTMSPYHWYATNSYVGVFLVSISGNLYSSSVTPGVRPVINLKSNVNITGEGTQNKPYIVE